MTNDRYTIALVSDVFHDSSGPDRLDACLAQARAKGAQLAVLPELPLNPWSMATKSARERDAEPPGGSRHRLQEAAARRAGIAVLGGVIVRDPFRGTRTNTALLINGEGQTIATYAKMHVPQEPGWWEASHYAPGVRLPQVVRALGPVLGIQICSDANRPVGAQYLAARGVEVILGPRATASSTYRRWRLAYRAMALMTGSFVVSVNRPRPELGVNFGGGSIVVTPSGDVVLETDDPVAVFALNLLDVARARTDYPGYLAYPAAAYAAAWQDFDSSGKTETP